VNDLFPPACVVVNAGTAVTIDALDVDGVFHGGLILPGMRLMLQALAENTSGLKIAPGGFNAFPDNTADALYSGAMRAVCGAIELMRKEIDTDPAHVRCYLAGGAAPEVAQHLNPPVEIVEDLVLEGRVGALGRERDRLTRESGTTISPLQRGGAVGVCEPTFEFGVRAAGACLTISPMSSSQTRTT
jgi:type III pantothenate kinase